MAIDNPNLISQEELANDLEKFTIVDASWYLPAQNRNGFEEYMASRIPGAVFFDIDKISDQNSDLPHMLPSPDEFEAHMGSLGISQDADIVVYDCVGLFSAARCWWSLKTFGAKSVRILQGGFDRWKAAGLIVEEGAPKKPSQSVFKSSFDASKVANYEQMLGFIKDSNATILDARPHERWLGSASEPRQGMRSGHMPGSFSLPASSLVENGQLLEISELEKRFKELKLNQNTKAVTTCGSGVTAAIIALALTSIGHEEQTLYDGSWAQWGSIETSPIIEWQ
ncbi:MAG: 3-mercaptopyruvate sulfurtransferase [Nitratireductor sp.]